ncbi:MAG: hypothetical protein HON53_06335 [Planctomycetaceae bacterium]|jgi:hypothetical protein|nr:hypothetical protein [Planctomycetaceae bacterium]MBT6155705.1 hypothetical protein [Planctomycetaceae bacterium]MBT6484988.1 hypothetical protein [Planctomycetaceae bacterium]MBT6497526.1 hypothetical protein [Planctomycetaceae bacterium]
MVCTHLHELYQLCETQQLRLSSSDLIHVVCTQCDQQEVCPSTLTDEYDAQDSESAQPETSSNDAS